MEICWKLLIEIKIYFGLTLQGGVEVLETTTPIIIKNSCMITCSVLKKKGNLQQNLTFHLNKKVKFVYASTYLYMNTALSWRQNLMFFIFENKQRMQEIIARIQLMCVCIVCLCLCVCLFDICENTYFSECAKKYKQKSVASQTKKGIVGYSLQYIA